jgi:hypothetical protein
MRGGRPDRLPLLEEGLRDDVLENWQKQGLASRAALEAMCIYDRREVLDVNLRPHPPLKHWPNTRREIHLLENRLDPEDPARFPEDWARRVEAWRDRDHLLQLNIHRGFFQAMGVGAWDRFLEVMYLLTDDPRLVDEIMRLQAEFSARLARRILRDVDVDMVVFSEPIGGNDRPLLSPAMYERFVLPGYRSIIETLRDHGVKTIVFMTYANARALLPNVVDAGFNCMWACEVESGAMDYRSIRTQFGRALSLIGGIDLDALLTGKDAIQREFDAKVSPLLEDGGFVPLADGRVRSSVPFRNYIHYRRRLEECAGRVGR